LFASTHWSVVLRAGDSQSPESSNALEKLCRSYWYPLYAFVRRQGYGPEDAADLTQEFFSRLLASKGLAGVDRRKGKFRSFLLASMKHLLANEWNRANRQKRGGGQVHFSLDAAAAEDQYRHDGSEGLAPDRIFERRWAETLIDTVTLRLHAEFEDAGMANASKVLKIFLLGRRRNPPPTRKWQLAEYHRERRFAAPSIACASGTGPPPQEIAQTVAGPGEIEEELRHFLAY
jgi:RNA polymerase sigma-70 factor (ECF subfamily)